MVINIIYKADYTNKLSMNVLDNGVIIKTDLIKRDNDKYYDGDIKVCEIYNNYIIYLNPAYEIRLDF